MFQAVSSILGKTDRANRSLKCKSRDYERRVVLCGDMTWQIRGDITKESTNHICFAAVFVCIRKAI